MLILNTKKKKLYLFFGGFSSQKCISVWKPFESSNDVQGILEIVLDHSQWIILWKPWCNIVDPYF